MFSAHFFQMNPPSIFSIVNKIYLLQKHLIQQQHVTLPEISLCGIIIITGHISRGCVGLCNSNFFVRGKFFFAFYIKLKSERFYKCCVQYKKSKAMLMCVFPQVPLSVIVAWILGIKMDLNFNILETSSLALAIIITAFTLQVNVLL